MNIAGAFLIHVYFGKVYREWMFLYLLVGDIRDFKI